MQTSVHLKNFIDDLEHKLFLHPRVSIQVGDDTIVSFDGMSPQSVIAPEIYEKAAIELHLGTNYASLLLEKINNLSRYEMKNKKIQKYDKKT